MTSPTGCSPLGSGKLEKAVRAFCDLLEQYPEKSRRQLLREIELRFDLSPLECEFLDKHLDDCNQQ
jgi:hypothetical protein